MSEEKRYWILNDSVYEGVQHSNYYQLIGSYDGTGQPNYLTYPGNSLKEVTKVYEKLKMLWDWIAKHEDEENENQDWDFMDTIMHNFKKNNFYPDHYDFDHMNKLGKKYGIVE